MISIIIPARNAHGTLRELLHSISASSFKDIEVIVVDDASTDDTSEIARECGATVVRFDKQSGPAFARNRGAEMAHGDLLLFLDSDVRLRPETLAYIHRRFLTEPRLNCLVGIYSEIPLNKGIFPAYKALFIYFLFKDATEMESFETSCGAIRKAVFREMGGFNTNYSGADVEDYELGYRLGGKYRVVLDTKIQVDHHYPGFLRNARNFFNRGRLWFTLFLKRRRFDSAGTTTPAQATGTAASLPVIVAGGYWIAGSSHGGMLLACACMLYFVLNGRFFLYCATERGIVFALIAVPLHFVNSLIVLAAVCAALVTSLCGRRFVHPG